jgi:hypothetical protein
MRSLLLSCLIFSGSLLEGQVIDEGTFSIRQAGREIGREDFSIRPGRQGVPTGSTVTSRVRLPAVNPRFTQESVLERKGDGSFANLVVTYSSRESSGRVIAEVSRNVLRIHSASGGSEGIRELAAPANLIGLEDSAFALYALVPDMATQDGGQLTGFFPRSGLRRNFTVRRESNGQEGTRIVMAGELAGTIWLDGAGHLIRIEFPESNLEIVRLPK